MSLKNNRSGEFLEILDRHANKNDLNLSVLVTALEQILDALKDDRQAETIRKTIPTLDPVTILGVPFPELRKLAKVLMAYPELVQQFLEDNTSEFNSCFEMGVLKCFTIELFLLKDQTVATKLMHDFVNLNVKNWMVCDTLAGCLARLPQVLTDEFWQKELEPYLFIDHRLYATRLAIVVATKFYTKNFKKCKVFLEQLMQVTNPYFYCQMAISWALATAFTAYPHYCYTFLKHHADQFLPWTFNKAILKINQSFKVNAADKKIVSRLKIEGTFKAPKYSSCTLSVSSAAQLETIKL